MDMESIPIGRPRYSPVGRVFMVEESRTSGWKIGRKAAQGRQKEALERIANRDDLDVSVMEWTLETVLEFLQPLLDAYRLDKNNIFSVAFEPGGMELVQYSLDENGDKIIVGDSIKMQSDFYPYLA
jgi:hypothetical protein